MNSCVSPTCTDHLFGKQECVRSRDVLPSLGVCHVVLWIVLPLHKAVWVFVYSAVFLLYQSQQQMETGGKT